MAKDAAKMRKAIHPTKNDIIRGVEYYKSLSPDERLVIDKARKDSLNVFSFLCGAFLLLIPLMFFSLFW